MSNGENRTREETGARLREYRKAHGLKQKDLASRLGVQNKTIIRFESGESTPGADQLAILKEKDPDLSLDWLVMGEGEMRQSDPGQITISKEAKRVIETLDDVFETLDEIASAPTPNTPENLDRHEEMMIRLVVLSGMLAEYLELRSLRKAIAYFAHIIQSLFYKTGGGESERWLSLAQGIIVDELSEVKQEKPPKKPKRGKKK